MLVGHASWRIFQRPKGFHPDLECVTDNDCIIVAQRYFLTFALGLQRIAPFLQTLQQGTIYLHLRNGTMRTPIFVPK